MTATYKFAVTAQSVSRDERIIISRHVTLKAAQKAAKLGTSDFTVVAL
jgi:hypothetical protein